MTPADFDPKALGGRNRRLLYEWRQLEQGLFDRSDIACHVHSTNAHGLPISYLVDYSIHSLCGVTNIENLNQPGIINEPLYADHFRLLIELPPNYPQIDAPPLFRFLSQPTFPLPWHPNIRFFGNFAGRVCLNATDTYTELLWGVRRIASYLRYECYHAINEPPYPEDLQVAQWVVRQGEPNGWIFF